MSCKTILNDLKSYLGNEPKLLAAWRLGCKPQSCSHCTTQYQKNNKLNILLLAITISCSLPVKVQPQPLRAAVVGDALSKVKTSHFKGWHLVKGEKVPWEIWCHREPFFYYEAGKGALLQDNGSQLIRIVPADPETRKPQSIILTPLVHSGTDLYNMDYRLLIHTRDWYSPHMPDGLQSPTQTLSKDHFNFEITLGPLYAGGPTITQTIVINAKTHLPESFIAERTDYKDGQIQKKTQLDYLEATYDDTDPANLKASPIDRDAYVLDLTHLKISDSFPTSNVVEKDELNVQATPIAIDPDGNVLIRVFGWLGGVKLSRRIDANTYLHMAVNMGSQANPVAALANRNESRDDHDKLSNRIDPPAPRLIYADERNRPYIIVQSALECLPNGEWLVLLAPLEPIKHKVDRDRSKKLKFTLAITPMALIKAASDIKPSSDNQLFTQELSWTVSLEKSHSALYNSTSIWQSTNMNRLSAVQSLSVFYPKSSRRFRQKQFLESSIARERAGTFYMNGIIWKGAKPAEAQEWLRQAIRWQARAIAVSSDPKQVKAENRYTLAYYQAVSGDSKAAAANLKAILTEANHHSDWKTLQRQARHALKHLNKPLDWQKGW